MRLAIIYCVDMGDEGGWCCTPAAELLCYYELLCEDCTAVCGMQFKVHGGPGVRRVLAECAGVISQMYMQVLCEGAFAGLGQRIFQRARLLGEWWGVGEVCALGAQVKECGCSK